jgi:hypothetical protein
MPTSEALMEHLKDGDFVRFYAELDGEIIDKEKHNVDELVCVEYFQSIYLAFQRGVMEEHGRKKYKYYWTLEKAETIMEFLKRTFFYK